MRYTYQQLEVIRERARALGMDAELESRASDPEEPYLRIHQIAGCGSLTYFLDVGRLTGLSGWGSLQADAAEIDAVHATLTADFVEPVEPEEASDAAPVSLWDGPEIPL